MPTVKPDMDSLTVNVCGAVPDVGETVSHCESLAAVKLSVPPPEFDTDTDEPGGLAEPTVPSAEIVDGLTARIGEVDVVIVA